MQHLKDYYQVLGVPTNADAPEIKKAYRALARLSTLHSKKTHGEDGKVEAEQGVAEAMIALP